MEPWMIIALLAFIVGLATIGLVGLAVVISEVVSQWRRERAWRRQTLKEEA